MVAPMLQPATSYGVKTAERIVLGESLGSSIAVSPNGVVDFIAWRDEHALGFFLWGQRPEESLVRDQGWAPDPKTGTRCVTTS